MTLTKAHLIEKVHEKIGFSKRESSELVELFFDTIKESLTHGENVKLSGFGTFQVRFKKARRGRNPQTGGQLEIRERHVLSFHPSTILKKRVKEVFANKVLG